MVKTLLKPDLTGDGRVDLGDKTIAHVNLGDKQKVDADIGEIHHRARAASNSNFVGGGVGGDGEFVPVLSLVQPRGIICHYK